MHRLFPLASVALLLATFAVPPSFAGDDDHERRDEIRRAREAGEVLPLADILNRVRRQIGGDIAGIEVAGEHGRWHYQLRVIDRTGRMLEVKVDAHSGAIEQVEEK